MDEKLAIEKARQLKISIIQVAREEYEMILLSGIFESVFGSKLVFRGGTALRLAYNSPRFSDDLDFSLIEAINIKDFQKWCGETAKNNEYVVLVETLRKQFTFFALFKIKDPILSETISIKVEIFARKERWQKEKDYLLMRLQSEVTPLTALAQVATLAKIKKEKLRILPPRIRDIFDLWFIGQKLNKTYKMDFSNFTAVEVKRELNRLLPEGERRLIEQWLPRK